MRTDLQAVIHLRAKDSLSLQELSKGQGTDSPSKPSEGANLDLGFLVSSTETMMLKSPSVALRQGDPAT
jgi:hypothetical protein